MLIWIRIPERIVERVRISDTKKSLTVQCMVKGSIIKLTSKKDFIIQGLQCNPYPNYFNDITEESIVNLGNGAIALNW